MKSDKLLPTNIVCGYSGWPCTPSLVVDPTSLVGGLPKPVFHPLLLFLCLLPAGFPTFLKPQWYIQCSTTYMPCTVAIMWICYNVVPDTVLPEMVNTFSTRSAKKNSLLLLYNHTCATSHSHILCNIFAGSGLSSFNRFCSLAGITRRKMRFLPLGGPVLGRGLGSKVISAPEPKDPVRRYLLSATTSTWPLTLEPGSYSTTNHILAEGREY